MCYFLLSYDGQRKRIFIIPPSPSATLFCGIFALSASTDYISHFDGELRNRDGGSGESARLPALSPGFNPARWVEFVVGWVFAVLRRFFSGFYGFPPSTKTNISKFQYNQDREPAWKPAENDAASSLNIVIYGNLFRAALSLFQGESKCDAILMKMTLICMKMKLDAELIFIWIVSHSF